MMVPRWMYSSQLFSILPYPIAHSDSQVCWWLLLFMVVLNTVVPISSFSVKYRVIKMHRVLNHLLVMLFSIHFINWESIWCTQPYVLATLVKNNLYPNLDGALTLVNKKRETINNYSHKQCNLKTVRVRKWVPEDRSQRF